MSLVPRPASSLEALPLPLPLSLSQETVTVPLLDLYDLLTRRTRKELPVPDLTRATTVKKAKRGYRRLSMTIMVAEYNLIAAMAQQEDRSPEQQALHMLRQLLKELHAEAIKAGYRESVAGREAEDGTAEDAVDPHGFALGEVARTE
jgi:hypothetical protein